MFPSFKNTTTIDASGTGTNALCTSGNSLGPLDGLTREQVINLRTSLNQYLQLANEKVDVIVGKQHKQGEHGKVMKICVTLAVGTGTFLVAGGISWILCKHTNPPKQIKVQIRE